MDDLSPKDRLLGALAGRRLDRAPVICPGGMMNSAVVEIMESSGHELPAAHSDQALMTALAEDVQSMTGFENLGLPFCMTVEPEALGSAVNLGSRKCEPKIASEALRSAADFRPPPIGTVADSPRARATLSSIAALAAKWPDLPVIGSLTGPVSVAASVVEPARLLRELRKDRDSAHRLLSHVGDQLADFAVKMIESGAAAVCLNDPTATGEILGPGLFGEYAVTYINRVAAAVRRLGVPFIVHVCGDIRSVTALIGDIDSQALSFDAMVNLARLKGERPGRAFMGNLSTYLLELGEPERIRRTAELLAFQGIDILAPACGLSTSTPLGNIRAFTEAAKRPRAGGPAKAGPPASGLEAGS